MTQWLEVSEGSFICVLHLVLAISCQWWEHLHAASSCVLGLLTKWRFSGWHLKKGIQLSTASSLLLFSRSVMSTLCYPMDSSTPGFPVLHHHPEPAQTDVHWVSDAIWPSHPLPPSSPPALNLSQHQGFSSESTLRIRWPKNWSLSFSISPSHEYSGLISFRIEWFDLLAKSPDLLFTWNSYLTGHPLLLFAKSGKSYSEWLSSSIF